MSRSHLVLITFVLVAAAAVTWTFAGAKTASVPLDSNDSVVRVIDANHLELKEHGIIKLAHTNVPDRNQCGGERAIQWLSDYAPQGTYVYIVAGEVFKSGERQTISAHMAEAGWTWPASTKTAAVERYLKKAQKEKRGLWGLCIGERLK